MKLINLSNNPKHSALVATCFHQEWASYNPTRTVDDVVLLINQLIDSKQDYIFIDIEQNCLVSTITYKNHELANDKGYAPWLSSLVVDNQCRGKGYSMKTVKLFEAYCAKLKSNTLYLFTENLVAWYE